MGKYIFNPLFKQGFQRIPPGMAVLQGLGVKNHLVVFDDNNMLKDSGFYINEIGEIVQETIKENGGYFA